MPTINIMIIDKILPIVLYRIDSSSSIFILKCSPKLSKFCSHPSDLDRQLALTFLSVVSLASTIVDDLFNCILIFI